MNSQKTLLAAAVLFALAACQPEPVGNNATAAAPLAGSAQDDQDPPDPQPVPPEEDDEDDEDNGDERDAEPSTDDIAASPAQATEQADAAATDALLDTRHGGNPLADPAIPAEPIAESDEDDDEDKR